MACFWICHFSLLRLLVEFCPIDSNGFANSEVLTYMNMVCSSPFNGLLFLKAYQCSWVVQQYDDQVCPQKDGLWVSDSEHRCKIFWFLQRGTITKYCSTVFILGFLLGLDFLSVWKRSCSLGEYFFWFALCFNCCAIKNMYGWLTLSGLFLHVGWCDLQIVFFSLCQDMDTSSWGSHWLPLTTITTCQESQLKERMGGNVVIENIQDDHRSIMQKLWGKRSPTITSLFWSVKCCKGVLRWKEVLASLQTEMSSTPSRLHQH